MKQFESTPYPQFKKGMQFQMVGNFMSFYKGDIITLQSQDGSIAPRFKNQVGVKMWLYWNRLAPLEPLTDTPHPEVPEGTKFLVMEGSPYFTIGEIVTLTDNDNTSMPKFGKENGEEWYMHWSHVAPLTCLLEAVSPTAYEEAKEEEEEDCSCEKLLFGVQPLWLLDKERMLELLEAMTRYANVGKSIPQEWLEELEELNASL